MITKNIFKIHILYYVVGFICFITGNFKDFIIFSSIIIVHECGHLVGAILFKWKIEKVVLLPFGGITIFNEPINHSLKEEFIIAILGPIFQILFFLLFRQNPLFFNYNLIILIFNMLPIIPLDGSKIFSVILNKLFSYKMSNYVNLTISILVSVMLFSLYTNNIMFLFILMFLVKQIVCEFINQKYYHHKFLLERYLYNFPFKKKKRIKNVNQMQQEKEHIFCICGKYQEEQEFLRKMFDKGA